jgi:hypothetical protein
MSSSTPCPLGPSTLSIPRCSSTSQSQNGMMPFVHSFLPFISPITERALRRHANLCCSDATSTSSQARFCRLSAKAVLAFGARCIQRKMLHTRYATENLSGEFVVVEHYNSVNRSMLVLIGRTFNWRSCCTNSSCDTLGRHRPIWDSWLCWSAFCSSALQFGHT